jgi:hypothetical protein
MHEPDPSKKFTALEASVMRIANTLMKSQAIHTVSLPMIISMGQAGSPQSALEFIATVYNLRYRQIFIPVDPSSLND